MQTRDEVEDLRMRNCREFSAVTKSGTGTWDLGREDWETWDSGTPGRGTQDAGTGGRGDVARENVGTRDVGRGDSRT